MARTPTAPAPVDDLEVLERDEAIEQRRKALPTAEEVGPWGRLARQALDARDHSRGCPVVEEGIGRVEAFGADAPGQDGAIIAVDPPPAARNVGIDKGDLVTVIRCLECEAHRYFKGGRRAVLRELAGQSAPPSSGKDTVLA